MSKKPCITVVKTSTSCTLRAEVLFNSKTAVYTRHICNQKQHNKCWYLPHLQVGQLYGFLPML